MDKTRHIFLTIILTILLAQTKAQSEKPISFGLGFNSSMYFYSNYWSLPSIPVTPYLTFKIKRHELLVGPDFYPMIKKFTIIGGQAGYRYHFLNEKKPLHFFIDCNFQYASFQTGCGGPRPYDDAQANNFCYDGAIFKNKSFVNTYGMGAELKFLKRFSLYAIAGGGYNYLQLNVYKNWSGYDLPEGNFTSLIAYLRGGLSFNIYQSKKPDACYGVIPAKETKDK